MQKVHTTQAILPCHGASSPILYPPPLWTNQHILLYHGTVDTAATGIVAGPIRVRLGRTHTDFGPGFYTTTLLRQAHTWAAQIAASKPRTRPAVYSGAGLPR